MEGPPARYIQYGYSTEDTILLDHYNYTPPFRKITQIIGYQQKAPPHYITALEIYYDGSSDGRFECYRDNKEVERRILNLRGNEFVEEILGRRSVYISEICIYTTWGRNIFIGKCIREGHKFSLNMKGHFIRDIAMGNNGGYLDIIGAHFWPNISPSRPLPPLEQNEESNGWKECGGEEKRPLFVRLVKGQIIPHSYAPSTYPLYPAIDKLLLHRGVKLPYVFPGNKSLLGRVNYYIRKANGGRSSPIFCAYSAFIILLLSSLFLILIFLTNLFDNYAEQNQNLFSYNSSCGNYQGKHKW